MRNFKRFFIAPSLLLTSVSLSLVMTSEVSAEIECLSEVSYSWIRAADDLARDAGVADPVSPTSAPSAASATDPSRDDAKSKASPPSPPGPSGMAASERPNPKVQSVKFLTVARKASGEEAAKAALQQELQRQRHRAAERCKRAHESTGECLTTKLSIKASTLNSLSFSARAQAEKALVEECQMQQGRCLSVDASVPSCRDVSVGPAVESSGATAGGAKVAAESKADTKGKDPKPKEAKTDKAKAAPKKK